jgi:guanine deaminase
VDELLKRKSALITPIITPRFVPTCSPELMKFLGKLASQYNLPIQSHISENLDEVRCLFLLPFIVLISQISFVKSLHPEHETYGDVYEQYGLLNHQTIMAHGVHLTDKEISSFVRNQSVFLCN